MPTPRRLRTRRRRDRIRRLEAHVRSYGYEVHRIPPMPLDLYVERLAELVRRMHGEV